MQLTQHVPFTPAFILAPVTACMLSSKKSGKQRCPTIGLLRHEYHPIRKFTQQCRSWSRYDENRQRTQVTAKIGEYVDSITRYEYDAIGKITGIVQDAKRVNYTYNAAEQRTSTSFFAGTQKIFDTIYGYDTA